MTTNLHDKMLAAIDALFSASDAAEEEVAENLLLDVRDVINKHKLAADSITEGLRLDDWPKIGCVNHDCDQCKAQQEPVDDNSPSDLDYTPAGGGVDGFAPQLPAQQEPVGYLYEGIEYHTKGMRQFSEKQVRNLEARWWRLVGPVYTTPQPPAQPLTDEQKDAARWRYMRQKHANWPAIVDRASDNDFDGGLDEAVDEAIAAHGITKGT